MVKQTKRFKKGGMAKKVLSAILAASMVMTSSCLAFAAPVEEPVAVVEEDAVTVGEAAPVEEEPVVEDVQGRVAFTNAEISIGGKTDNSYVVNYDAEAQEPAVVVKDSKAFKNLTKDKDYTVEYLNNVDAAEANEKDPMAGPCVAIQFIGEYAQYDTVYKPFTINKATLSAANLIVEYDQAYEFVYNGTEQYPELTKVAFKANNQEYELSADDFEVVAFNTTAQDGIKAGAQKFKIVVKEDSKNYKAGTVTNNAWTYTIQKAAFTEDAVDVKVKPIIYSGTVTEKQIRDSITITDKVTGKEVDKTKLTITPVGDAFGADIGSYDIKLTFADDAAGVNFAGTIETKYEVAASETLQSYVDKAAEKIGKSYVYDGKTDVYDTVLAAVKALPKYDQLFTVKTEDSEWTNVGEYVLELEGLNTYKGESATITVKVTPKTLTPGITATTYKHQSNGEMGEVAVTVKDGATVLEENVDYVWETVTKEVSGKEVAYVVVTGIGNYTTEGVAESKLEKVISANQKMNLAADCVDITIADQKYTGKAVTLSEDDIVAVETDGGESYTLGYLDDFYISGYKNNTAAGVATATITAKGSKYTGSVSVEFKIVGTEFGDEFNVEMDEKTFENTTALDRANELYNAVEKEISVKRASNGSKYTNYKVEIFKGEELVKDATNVVVEPGAYTVKVSDKSGKYQGTVDFEITVTGEDVTDEIKVEGIADKDYTGKAITQDLTLTYEKETLKAGEDYDVAYEDNINAGVAKVVITLKGDYSGKIVRTFKINKVAQTVTLDPRQAGKNGLLNRTTGDKDCTMRLTLGVEDELAKYTFESSNPEVAKVSAKGVISYQSVGTATIKITVTSPNTEDAVLEQTVNVTKLGKASFTPTVTTRTPAKSFTVTSNTVKGAEGWQVRFSRFENMKSATTKSFYGVGKKLSRQTLTAKWADMEYYVQVRPYYTNADGEKVFSDWSAAKTTVSAATK